MSTCVRYDLFNKNLKSVGLTNIYWYIIIGLEIGQIDYNFNFRLKTTITEYKGFDKPPNLLVLMRVTKRRKLKGIKIGWICINIYLLSIKDRDGVPERVLLVRKRDKHTSVSSQARALYWFLHSISQQMCVVYVSAVGLFLCGICNTMFGVSICCCNLVLTSEKFNGNAFL